MSKKVKNTELIEKTEVENTPFVVVKHEMDIFITLGHYRISPAGKFLTKQDAIAYCKKSNNWELLATFIGILVESYVKQIKTN